jgi:hypothetical protein
MFPSQLPQLLTNCDVSAIAYSHKLHNWPDPTASFLIHKLLTSCRRKNNATYTRLPITKAILHTLISALPYTTSSQFRQSLFRAMLLLAFHAFLRIGEITVTNQTTNHTLQYHQLWFDNSGNLQITFTNYTFFDGRPFQIVIQKQRDTTHCPILAIKSYVQTRETHTGPLFCHSPTVPVTRDQFTTQLRQCLQYVNLDPLQIAQSENWCGHGSGDGGHV